MKRTRVIAISMAIFLLMFSTILVHGQFIHIFEIQDENRAPKSDLFDPSQYKYVSPSQLQKQQEQNKLLQQQQQQNTKPTAENQSRSLSTVTSMTSNVPEIRRNVPTANPSTAVYTDIRLNEISSNENIEDKLRIRNQNAYSINEMSQHHNNNNNNVTKIIPNVLMQNGSTVTYMQPISHILTNISNINQIPEQYESEIRKQIRMQQSENRYSRTTPLRVSAQNQRQYVVRVPAPFTVNLSNVQPAPNLLPQQQLPPNLQQLSPSSANQYTPVHPISHQSNQTNIRLSTLNSVLISPSHTDNGIPSNLLNAFLQRTQNQQAQNQQQTNPSSYQIITQPQPPYATNLPQTYQTTTQTPQSAPLSTPQPNIIPSVSTPTGRSVNGVSSNSITLLQPPITNKESLTDEDIKLIEEHNRKVRMFLRQRHAELAAEQERIRRQKLAEAEAQAKAAEQERIRRLKAEQEAAAREAAEQERIRLLKAEQEAAARAAAEQERIRRLKAEQEAAARAAAEQERIRRLKAEQEAAARAAAEQERIRRINAEQERIVRFRAEQERIARIRAEQEAAVRAAAEQERIRRLKVEQERIRRLKAEQEALEQERLRKIREEQEMAVRAEQERLRRIREEQERYQKLKAEQEEAAEQERQRQLRAQQEAAIRLAEAERLSRLHRLQGAQELTSLRYQNANLMNTNITTNSLAYQPEPSLALDEATLVSNNKPQNVLRSQPDNVGLVDAARIRAEKEALAEQERLLRFQANQQALAHQQAAEQNRLRRLREEELLQAEAERLAREAQERQILQARNEQDRLIQAAREAAIQRDQSSSLSYTPYTEDLNKYENGNNYTMSRFGSLNNVRTPEITSNTINIRTISDDYSRRSNSNQITTPTISSSAKNETAFKPAKISLQELPPDLDRDGIPGVAGRDYPTLIEIPKTSFSCARQPLNGYYADTETACQVVHMCQMGGVQDSFICPNGTIWNQEKFACQWWYEVNCATAPSFYALNNNLYKVKFDGKSERDSSPSLSPSSSS